MAMIEFKDIKKRYHDNFQLSIAQLALNKGEIIGFVGNNGAGKTTLFRLILDLTKPDSGEVTINGKNVCDSDEWRLQTSCYLDDGFLLGYMDIMEFLAFKAEMYNMSRSEFDTRFNKWKVLFGENERFKGTLIKDLSTGNKQKVGIISAAMFSKDLLILDEPFNYLDPSSQIKIMNLLNELNRECGTTILLSSHNLEYVAELSKRVILLENGTIHADLDTKQTDVKTHLKDYFLSFSTTGPIMQTIL
jgi:ABC-2 type transport system ATP-binding protein